MAGRAGTTTDIETQLVANLVQGVSQQAEQQRRDTQCEAQWDCFNSPSEGAQARPCAEVVKVWLGRTLTGAFFSEIVRDTENYLTGVYNAAMFSINLDTGVDGTITGNTNADGYLTAIGGALPRDQFRTVVVEDTTFILNRLKSPLMDSTILSPVRYPEALLFVRAGGQNIGYKVTITGKNGNANNAASAYATNGANASDHNSEGTTSRIADRLTNGGAQGWSNGETYTDPAPALNGQNGYTAVRSGSVVKINRADHGDFDIATEDGNGDDFMYAFKEKAQSFTKLPAKGFDGMVLEVKGDDRAKGDSYFVQFQGPTSTGFWNEVVAPNTKTTLKKDTMPHAMVNTSLDNFAYSSKDWSTRIAGDGINTAKDPGFIGKLPRDIFYHQNRLGVLYTGGAVWSKARFPFTYFPDTVQAALAEAPVDVTLVPGQTTRGASEMDFAVQIDESLFLWSPKAQFRVTSGQDNFKQDSVAANPSTAYLYSRICDPLAVGQFLYFPSDVGPHSAIRSVQFYQGKPNGDITVTNHVQDYLADAIRYMTASDTLGVMFAVSDNDPTILYVYNFLFEKDEYIQSAWNKWRIPGGNILWASINDNNLRVLQQRSEGVALLNFNLTPKAVDPITGALYATRLDLRVDETKVTSASYNSSADTYSFTLPYQPATSSDFRVITREDKTGGYSRGREFPLVSIVGRVVTVKGDLTGYKFYAGHRIRSERTESRFFIRNQQGIVPTDRLTVADFTVQFADTGYTRIEVATPNKDTKSYAWEARTAGLPGSAAGTPGIGTDSLTAPVKELAQNATITLVNDSFLPSKWQSASYQYTAVGKAGMK
ncbi:hypothetical protein [Mesorhizobium sp. WSM4982]|uniref:phage nozzle protein n=1 Tax=Mesorhizobium sp. WSM4982 TaxID=3038550 RepID=UPI0024157AF1|nr:hypothetical protein [Mesorhizobium sp. WSM4982]MDG4856427.1 hypothetical protein [Mesorhizobium sp. WSM4982]